MAECPCGSGSDYEVCCAPFIKRTALPATAEALMRSRYSAYTTGDVDYIFFSSGAAVQKEFDEESTRQWADSAEWHGMEVVEALDGDAGSAAGTVEFIAHYTINGRLCDHRELAEFERIDGIWKFIDGKVFGPDPIRRSDPKVGRNDPCPCGSKKKFKKCCAKKTEDDAAKAKPA